MKGIEDFAVLEEIAEGYAEKVFTKNYKDVNKELMLMEDDTLKALIIEKINKKIQKANSALYKIHPNLEIRIGG